MIKPHFDFWNDFKTTNGAMSCCESLALINIAHKAPLEGTWIELGSFKGKSSISAAYSQVRDKEFNLVDPIFADIVVVEEVAKVVSKYFKPVFINGYSETVIHYSNDYSYVMVDSGSHQDGLPMREVKLLEDRMVTNGIIAFHDFDSQFKEVREAADYLVSTGKYEYMPIDWEEIKKYVRENDLETGNTSWHHSDNPFPCFLGAVKRKA